MNHLAKRIIPCLDIKNGKVVKGVNFVGLQDVGDPLELAKLYNDAGADELVILDITATFEHRQIIADLIRNIAKEVYIPLTIGGGIRTLDDMYLLLDAGADKISLNSTAIKNPELIEQAAKRFGSQCVVIAIDVRSENWEGALQGGRNGGAQANSTKIHHTKKEVYIKGGRENTGIEMCEWAKICEDKGAGEFLLTSMDTDGTKNGYDIDALTQLRESVSLPIIASGGAGKMEHIAEVFEMDVADAALAASIFHNNEITIADLKRYLDSRGIPVRI
ncbi:imidazole glycerol phosphate synthase subunit HisF [Helicobacter sp. CLO-3]|uniref:imidazole glycerol phosphate synthase subunit HisF n=1 Tax=unclassified Helicobacter TaxID=2593540 RepID=UPI000804B7F4|nr:MULTISPECIES: imidazole glycerol phosphate synthase subunit HisF [unclassified Helicobacter]OBV28373.1 imidazole glycerol phosphate synthase subunit HisF [Helicobacter sp. CLO-3]OHU82931.1 imidazole glycerol phosphate synthase subunit HisF [Helicobacter sp. CLO-3]